MKSTEYTFHILIKLLKNHFSLSNKFYFLTGNQIVIEFYMKIYSSYPSISFWGNKASLKAFYRIIKICNLYRLKKEMLQCIGDVSYYDFILLQYFTGDIIPETFRLSCHRCRIIAVQRLTTWRQWRENFLKLYINHYWCRNIFVKDAQTLRVTVCLCIYQSWWQCLNIYSFCQSIHM